VVAVDPEEGHGLAPAAGDDLAARVQKADGPVGAGANHVAEEGRAVLGAELAAARPDEGLVRFDCVDGGPVTFLGAAREHGGRAPAVAPHFDDAALPDLGGEAEEEQGGVAGQPPLDRRDVAQLLRPVGMFSLQT